MEIEINGEKIKIEDAFKIIGVNDNNKNHNNYLDENGNYYFATDYKLDSPNTAMFCTALINRK